MEKRHPIKKIVQMQKEGIHKGIYSICSSNHYVIQAAMETALAEGDYLLIESTANQVNQFGGYSGMRPRDFKKSIFKIAEKIDFPSSRIILGGDHLGPLVWKDEDEHTAMDNAHELIREYVLAGFTKIHIDTSMRLAGDDKGTRLASAVIAERGTALCNSAVQAFKSLKNSCPQAGPLVYVIGSEVPVPGGSQDAEEKVQVTKARDFLETVEVFSKTFKRYGLEEIWDDVAAIVVQPGVEFGDDVVHGYNREAAKKLCALIKKYPTMVFEGHSTDYQTAFSLRQMVEDGIAILKIGPALTFALREGLFALNIIENELFGHRDKNLSRFIDVLDEAMVNKPENWKKYYHGSEEEIRLSRKYSLFDRCRYYLDSKEVKESIKLMISNLRSVEIPLSLISQFMPLQYRKIRCGDLINDPEEMLKDRIKNCLDDYVYAVSPVSKRKMAY